MRIVVWYYLLGASIVVNKVKVYLMDDVKTDWHNRTYFAYNFCSDFFSRFSEADSWNYTLANVAIDIWIFCVLSIWFKFITNKWNHHKRSHVFIRSIFHQKHFDQEEVIMINSMKLKTFPFEAVTDIARNIKAGRTEDFWKMNRYGAAACFNHLR